jgi:hypothetical protein
MSFCAATVHINVKEDAFSMTVLDRQFDDRTGS